MVFALHLYFFHSPGYFKNILGFHKMRGFYQLFLDVFLHSIYVLCVILFCCTKYVLPFKHLMILNWRKSTKKWAFRTFSCDLHINYIIKLCCTNLILITILRNEFKFPKVPLHLEKSMSFQYLLNHFLFQKSIINVFVYNDSSYFSPFL